MAKLNNFIMLALLALMALLSVSVGDNAFVSPIRGPDPGTNFHHHHSSTRTISGHSTGPASSTTHVHTIAHLPSAILPRDGEDHKHSSESTHYHPTAPSVVSHHHTVSSAVSHHPTASSVVSHHHTAPSVTTHVHTKSHLPSAIHPRGEEHRKHSSDSSPPPHHHHHTPPTTTVHISATPVFNRDEQHWSAWPHSTPTGSHVFISRTIGLDPERSSMVSVPSFSKASSMKTITGAPNLTPSQAPSQAPSQTSCATDDPLCFFTGGLNSVFKRDIPHPTVATESHPTESHSSTHSHFGPGIPYQTEPKPNQHTHKWTWITSYTWADSTTQPATPAPLATFSGNMCVDC